MSRASAHLRVRDVIRRAAACAGVAIVGGAAAAACVGIAGLGAELREVLGFEFRPWDRTPDRALSIAAHNSRLALAVLLCAAAASRLGPARRACLDVCLAAAWLHNSALVGIAWSAYGARLGAAVALHLPVELAAMSLAGAMYLSGRRAHLPLRTLLASAGACAGLLVAGGFLETYTPLAGRR